MRLIDADAFEVFTYTHRNNDFDNGVQYVLEAIDNAPTIEPKKGKWHQRIYQKVEMMVCSECFNEFSYDAETGVRDYNFCPNCGADMRGKQE